MGRSKVSSIRGFYYFLCGFHSREASTYGFLFYVDLKRLLFEGGFYPRAASIQGRLLSKGGFYLIASSIQGRLLSKGGFYSRAVSIQGRFLFKKIRCVNTCMIFQLSDRPSISSTRMSFNVIGSYKQGF